MEEINLWNRERMDLKEAEPETAVHCEHWIGACVCHHVHATLQAFLLAVD